MNKRQQVVDLLEARLKAIHGINRVTQWRVNDIAQAELPSVNIRDTTDEMPSDGVIGRLDHLLQISLTVNVLRSDKAPKQARQLAADIVAAIGTDKTFNDLAYDTVINNIELDLDNASTAFANATINITVNYRTGLWSI